MTQFSLSEHVVERLQQVAEERGASLMELVERTVEEYLAQLDYVEANDPAIKLIHGPTDLSSQAKSILAYEIESQSGWTQKEATL